MEPRDEERILTLWQEKKVYDRVRRRGEKPFYLCDGPPYVTGDLHPGTGWNKCVKDSIIRFYRMMGYRVLDKAGFDTHGLPIEVKVEKKLGIKDKKEIERMGIAQFIEECKRFADHYRESMTRDFIRLGISMDFENAYITYKDSYIEESWKTLKKAWERGLLEEDKYVVAYCPRCQTTMANYELEYKEKSDPAIYVSFPSSKGELVIWTTTPWTLPANLAVAVAADEDYVLLEWEGRRIIVAEKRKDAFQPAKEIARFKGEELVGLAYEMPLADLVPQRERRVLAADFVSMEEGTGLIHIAPGHGEDDFKLGSAHGLDIFSPVDDKGRYTDEVKGLAGVPVLEANDRIIQLLKERGALLKKESIRHRYPHCWRCKTPLIFRATKQWFIKISKLKDQMLAEVKKTRWVPDFAQTRMLNFVEKAPDWCISRQRYWGIPLPIWRCERCGRIKVIGSKAELGKDVELHRPYVDEITFQCECGGTMRRVPDVLDVWFDSGNAVWASMPGTNIEQADFIYEGQDQIRGWFYSLLGSGLVKNNKAPYKTVGMHGFFLDERGEKMSKSLGNYVPIEEIVQKYGADAFRLFVLSMTYWEDLKFSWQEMKKAKADLHILENIVEYLKRFYDPELGEKPEDRWLRSRLYHVYQTWRDEMMNFRPFNALRALRQFWLEDISRTYIKIKKGTKKEAPRALYNATLALLRMLEPFVPFTAEELYQRFFKEHEGHESIVLAPPPDVKAVEAPSMEPVLKIVEAVRLLREKVGIKQRWPLPAIEPKIDFPGEYTEALLRLANAERIGPVENAIENDTVRIPRQLTGEALERAKVKEIIRRIQVMRKRAGLKENDRALVEILDWPEIVSKYKTEIEEATGTVIDTLEGEAQEWETPFGPVRIKLRRG